MKHPLLMGAWLCLTYVQNLYEIISACLYYGVMDGKYQCLWHHMSTIRLYSNFRNYAKTLDEKCCIIMENMFLCYLGKLCCAGFALVILIWGFIDVPEKNISNSQKRRIFASFAERIY